ncbi:MutS-related protein [Candidatus Lokiarchaeum ossiferum]|uniref:lysine 5,6-aminomutase reactivase ATPase KamC n=1 Tax=Candidatus Lokiarchaeum ossiferum TaxID=2951803 RepID=UPI00352FD8C4
MIGLTQENLDTIGFTFLLNKLDTLTPFGKELKNNLRRFSPSEKELLITELSNIGCLCSSIQKNSSIHKKIDYILPKLRDIRRSLLNLQETKILDEVEIFELKKFAMDFEDFSSKVQSLHLSLPEMDFTSFKQVISLLDPNQTNIPTFYLYDSYSDSLQKIRERKRSLETKIFQTQDSELIKQLKEERLDVVILEREEELNVKKSLSFQLRQYTTLYLDNITKLGLFDFWISKAKLALEFGGVKPQISSNQGIKIKRSINPYVQSILNQSEKQFTPISIDLDLGVTIITGANMGGKTVSLQTLFLNVLLAHYGFFVFAKSVQIPLFDNLYFVSDDMQDVSAGLSTFGAEIITVNQIISSLPKKFSFIVMDEFARGTNPSEGIILIKALTQYLNSQNAISLITTHYEGISNKKFAHYQVMGLKNVDFLSLKHKIDLQSSQKYTSIQIIQEHMDYRLERVQHDSIVPKDALNIAILLGLTDNIVKYAKNQYNQMEKNDQYDNSE